MKLQLQNVLKEQNKLKCNQKSNYNNIKNNSNDFYSNNYKMN